jgi:hypothetical protein
MAERLAKDLATQANPEDDEVRESTYFRLESLGYRVGQGLAERCVDATTPPRSSGCARGYLGSWEISTLSPSFPNRLCGILEIGYWLATGHVD